MEPIIISFEPNNLGRIEFFAHVMTGDMKSFDKVDFILDSGSDFTTMSCVDLKILGYTEKFLKSCPFHGTTASTAADRVSLPLQYISNVSIKFGDRELQGCRVFFALGAGLLSLKPNFI